MVRAVMTTAAPSPARRSAMAGPIPRLAPVTMARRPRNRVPCGRRCGDRVTPASWRNGRAGEGAAEMSAGRVGAVVDPAVTEVGGAATGSEGPAFGWPAVVVTDASGVVTH